jgi:putative DNA primase/helicase
LQQWAGYCLTGCIHEHKLVFIHGPGGTGKSTLANILQRIMADYAIASAMETFTDSTFDRHPEEIARLVGRRLVVANETEAGHKWRENRIKTMTGGDLITARYMRENSFSFKPQFKILLVGNHAPTITNLDTAIQRRFLILPFLRKPAEIDLHLEETLEAEMPGILRWAINGAVDWYTHGLVVPKAVTEATTLYFDEQDVLGQFLEECCIVEPDNPNRVERSADLFAAWRTFSAQRLDAPGTQATFNAMLRARHGIAPMQIKALGTKGVRGIQLKLPAEDRYP